MTRFLLIAAMAASFPVTAQAQTWRGETVDTGGLIYGNVYAPEQSLGFYCNTPSPQRRPLLETEDHETMLNVPYGMMVAMSSSLTNGDLTESVLSSVTLTLDGTSYRMPPLEHDGYYEKWLVELSFDDPLFTALAGASELILDTGIGPIWRYPTDGLAAVLEAAIAACEDGWAQAGYGAAGQQAAGQAPTQPEGLMTPEIDAFIRQGCNADYTLDPTAIAAHDLDRDGQPDGILNWDGVTCDAIGARPFCGAANCSVNIFLSSRPGDPQTFVVGGYQVAQAPNGMTGLRFGGTVGDCQRRDCDAVLWWDGTQFRE